MSRKTLAPALIAAATVVIVVMCALLIHDQRCNACRAGHRTPPPNVATTEPAANLARDLVDPGDAALVGVTTSGTATTATFRPVQGRTAEAVIRAVGITMRTRGFTLLAGANDAATAVTPDGTSVSVFRVDDAMVRVIASPAPSATTPSRTAPEPFGNWPLP